MLFDDFRSKKVWNLLNPDCAKLLEVVPCGSLEHFLNEQSLRVYTQACPRVPEPATLHDALLVVERLLLSFRHDPDIPTGFISYIQYTLPKSALEASSLVNDTIALPVRR